MSCRQPHSIERDRLTVSVLTVLVLLLPALSANAGGEQVGTTGAAFLAIEAGTRAVGMGGAVTALPGGVDQLRWNPAALANQSAEFGFDHATLFAGLSHEWVAFVSRPGPGSGSGRYALAIGMLRVEPLEGRDAAGVPTATFDCYGAELGLTWSQAVLARNLTAGVTARVAREEIGETTGFGIAADVGLQYFRGRWRCGLAAVQLGPDYRFDGIETPLPRAWRLGGAVELRSPGTLTVTTDLHLPAASYASLRLGAEWRAQPGLWLRAGYRLEPGAPGEVAIAGPAFGTTVRLGRARAHYAYLSQGPVNAPNHRLGVTLAMHAGD